MVPPAPRAVGLAGWSVDCSVAVLPSACAALLLLALASGLPSAPLLPSGPIPLLPPRPALLTSLIRLSPARRRVPPRGGGALVGRAHHVQGVCGFLLVVAHLRLRRFPGAWKAWAESHWHLRRNGDIPLFFTAPKLLLLLTQLRAQGLVVLVQSVAAWKQRRMSGFAVALHCLVVSACHWIGYLHLLMYPSSSLSFHV